MGEILVWFEKEKRFYDLNILIGCKNNLKKILCLLDEGRVFYSMFNIL